MDPGRWEFSKEAVRNLERVRKLRRRMHEFGIVLALIMAYLLIGIIWI
jgi:hypothetical protein